LSHDLSLEMNVAEVKAEKESLKLRIDEAQGIIEKARPRTGSSATLSLFLSLADQQTEIRDGKKLCSGVRAFVVSR
jgi:hypothetical protein